VVGVCLIATPTLSGCNVAASAFLGGQELSDCLEVVARSAVENGAVEQVASDPKGVVAVTTSVTARCMESKDYTCTPQQPAGTWRDEFPREYMCTDSSDVGVGFGPTQVANALREAGVSVPSTLG
jgi:hypothetical protein